MKRLTLVRHAKSEKYISNDIDRELTLKGLKDIELVAKNVNFMPDFAISSPAKRALQSSKKFLEQINYNNKLSIIDRLYGATLSELKGTIRGIDNKYNSVIIFGHNPTFEEFSLHFINIEKFSTSSLISIQFNKEWQEFDFYDIVSILYLTPKGLK